MVEADRPVAGAAVAVPRAGERARDLAVQQLVTAVRPQLTDWYHQQMRLVSLEPGIDNAPVRAYARRVRLPALWLPYYPGTATTWQNHAFPGTTAFVVELPAGPLSRRAAERHARAALVVASPAAVAAAAPAPKPTIGRPRQLAASLRLTRWLQGRYGILTRDVIGHAESLSSPYHHERVRAMRNQTHGDFQYATMQRYRHKL